jgi:hypothetical protein
MMWIYLHEYYILYTDFEQADVDDSHCTFTSYLDTMYVDV